MFLTQEYNYNPVRTCNSSTARGPQLWDIASLEWAVTSGNFPISSIGRALGHSNRVSVVRILSVEVDLSVTIVF